MEEQRYLSTIKRERDAFKSLIDQKATMSVPLQCLDLRPRGPPAPSMDTRTEKRHSGPGRRVAVDMREFRSALPSFLHAAGLDLDAVS